MHLSNIWNEKKKPFPRNDCQMNHDQYLSFILQREKERYSKYLN